ncbi:MAG: thiol:disulfide interchange protein precursor [Pedosphaera sp.]|nr:thiol:disulfide interchange protein precursor [Pedosphaera sp.]
MKIKNIKTGRILFVLGGMLIGTLLLASAPGSRAEEQAKSPPLYDETADGSKQIVDALAQAKKENKRVLLQFGANWCGWCHKLHKTMETDAAVAEKLKSDYVVVLVDVNKEHNRKIIEGYHATGTGIPVIVVLDADGKQLTTKDTNQLEEGDHHNPKKILDFLNEWAVKRA